MLRAISTALMTDLVFKDHFSTRSDTYACYRPTYPDALFDWLARHTPTAAGCWDCATGSGQAAVSLSRYFDRVVATDASAEQINNAIHSEAIEYRVASAEHSGLDRASIGLIVVAQALHWFDIGAFFKEVDRVLKPQGVLAILSYNLLNVDAAIDEVILDLYHSILHNYWPPERLLIEQGYTGIMLPYPLLDTPNFTMEADWNLEQLMGYLNTWSAVKRYASAVGGTPLKPVEDALQLVWGDPSCKKRIRWPLTVHVAVKPSDGSCPVFSEPL